MNRLEKHSWYIHTLGIYKAKIDNFAAFSFSISILKISTIISAWHEVTNTKANYIGCKEKLADLLQQLLDFKGKSPERNGNGKAVNFLLLLPFSSTSETVFVHN